MTNTISYTVEASKNGWNVVRRDETDGSKRVVATKHSEYAAQLKANELKAK